MLVLDQLKTYLHHQKQVFPQIYTHVMRALENQFPSLEAFEITNLVPLFKDWDEEKNCPVPKVPPFSPIWVEYTDPETPTEKAAFYIVERDAKTILDVHKEALRLGQATPEQRETIQGVFNEIDNYPEKAVYECKGFYFMKGELTEDVFVSYVFINRADEQLRVLPSAYLKEQPEIKDAITGVWSQGLYNLRRRYSTSANEPDLVRCAKWPFYCFFAFALLNCKNIQAQPHPGQGPGARARRRRGEPPYTAYKTLELTVPVGAHIATHSRDPGHAPSKRFHICRGHFKHLTHDRYKNKGWHWWPAHWKGSPELGVVEKDYKLTPTQ